MRTLESTARVRFEKYIMVVPDGCWLWTASLTSTGYGQLFVGSRNRKAHQLAYEFYCGPIPVGMQLDHLCRQRTCVNPWHLEAVTLIENIQRGLAILPNHQTRKTHCPKGHEYTPENTYLYAPKKNNPSGRRECRICSNEYKTRWASAHPRGRDS